MATAPKQEILDAKVPTREQCMTFLTSGMDLMKSDETREVLKDPMVKKPGAKLVEVQRAGWAAMKIDADVGCAYLNELPKHFPGDQELEDKQQQFVWTSMRTYLAALEARRPMELETVKPLPRETIVEFFDACNVRMELPEFIASLASHMEETQQLPNKLIVEAQRDLLEVLGFERDHACAVLSNIPKDFSDDRDLLWKFQMWQQKAQMTCMKAVQMVKTAVSNDVLNGYADDIREAACKAIQAMTPAERGEFLMKLQPKLEVIQKLPPERRQDYVMKMSRDDRIELEKAQILIVSMHKQHMMQQHGHIPQCPHHGHGHGHGYGHDCQHGHGGYAAEPGKVVTGTSASKPSQQQMM